MIKNSKGKWALVTGASGGIGLELARIHAAHGGNLVLVARKLEVLEALKQQLQEQYKVNVLVFGMDLSQPESPNVLADRLSLAGVEVDYLINNAGFGIFGAFAENPWEREYEMMQLNMVSLTHLTKLVIPSMKRKGQGRILNVSSVAAFQPGPGMAIYFASKAYVLSFSEAIAKELKPFGISVTALCPGPTESGFMAASGMENSPLIKGRKLPSAEEVAKFGYRAMLKGQAVAIPGIQNFLLALAPRFFPRTWVAGITGFLLRKSRPF